MKFVLNTIYSILILPLVFFFAHIFGLINTKTGKALRERYKVLRKVKKWKSTNSTGKDIVIVHSASMGEFEHIKPLIGKLSQTFNLSVVVTFFSPSGYEHVKTAEGVDLIIYLPFDFTFLWKKLYRLVNPKLLVVSKHDAWPNQIWTAEKLDIPTFLVNASLRSDSSRVKILPRFFMSYVYRSMSRIYAISQRDEDNFRKFFPASKARFIGDTKFDQVLIRKEAARVKQLIPVSWTEKSTVLLLGSVWQEDWAPILPAVKLLMDKNSDLKVILVPHQPDKKTVASMASDLGRLQCALFTKIKNLADERVIIVDTVGVLADLYKYADISYVGGSFRQGIHNVMEAAIYQLPVIYGPKYKNSYEAVKLYEYGGSIVVNNSKEILTNLEKFIHIPKRRLEIGQKAYDFAMMHTGATDKLVGEWHPYFKHPAKHD